MSSSEEYLDNLLKSLMDDGSGGGADSSEVGAASADITGMQTDSAGETPMAREHNKAMSVDDIEAMFASMDQDNAVEENMPGEPEDMGILESDTTGQMPPGEADFDYDMQSDELALKNALDGLVLDDELLPDELELDGMQMPEELSLGEEIEYDESAMDELQMPDELTLDRMQISEDETLTAEFNADDVSASDDFALDDLVLDEASMEEMLPDASMSDGSELDEGIFSDELALNEEAMPDELAVDEGMLPDELALDEEAMPDELALDEGMLSDELALDEETMPDELTLDEEMLPDELALDEGMLSDELALDEGAMPDELTLDEGILPDELILEEDMKSEGLMTEEDTALDDLTLDDLDLGDLGLEEFDADGNDVSADDGGMSEEDIDHLLGDDFMSEESSESDALDDFALEESGGDDEDLSALLAGMENDEDLSEINDLLEKSDQGVAVDDDMLAMLDGASSGSDDDDEFGFFSDEGEKGGSESIREITPEELTDRDGGKDAKKQKKKEEKERKKREKKAKKAGKKGIQEETADEKEESGLEDLLGDMGDTQEKSKKQGAFSRFLTFLLEEDEEDQLDGGELDDSGAMIGSLSDENKELLAELKAEDKKNAKKKDKKEKKKGKKGKKDAAEAGAEGEEAAEEAKPKKPKKEKKKKKEKNVDEEPKTPEKKLSRKKVISVFLFCATVAACIILVTLVLPNEMEKQEARVAYDHNQYAQVYDLLYGKELSEEDEVLLQKSSIILQVQRKLESYNNYRKIDMPLEALDALLEGVKRYSNLADDASGYQIDGELNEVYGQILAALSETYGVSEGEALDIIASGDDVTYSQRLHVIIFGDNLGGDENESAVKKDVLPEEEGIIDRLQDDQEPEAEE